MPRYEKSKGLYLPVLTNERSSARIIGQAIVVPFLLFLFHTIKIHFRLIGIGARGSTPPHRPEWISKASCSYRAFTYSSPMIFLFPSTQIYYWNGHAPPALAFIPLSQPQEREIFACFGNVCFRLRSMWQSKRRKDVAQGLVQSPSPTTTSHAANHLLRFICPYVLFNLTLLLANQWNSFYQGGE